MWSGISTLSNPEVQPWDPTLERSSSTFSCSSDSPPTSSSDLPLLCLNHHQQSPAVSSAAVLGLGSGPLYTRDNGQAWSVVHL